MCRWHNSRFLVALLFVVSIVFSQLPVLAASGAKPTPWAYDAGPSLDTPMGIELIDLTAGIPNMPAISTELIGNQKFRPAFGPIPWRMNLEPNSVKILFIGQDGTHIAEAAARPATAGFGGRAQDLANHFGVDYSAAFINTYAFTIKGQYGAYQTPYIYNKTSADGSLEPTARFAGYVDNDLWLMTHNENSPVAKWRNDLIDWIIRNNQNSLKMIVLFGGAARDAAASFIESRGGKVGTRLKAKDLERIQVPMIKEVSAGGNNVFPIPLSKDEEFGHDLYAQLLGRKLSYSNVKNQEAAMEYFKDNPEKVAKKMLFTKGGSYNNGIIHAGQLGGYDLRKISVGGQSTLSIKGLQLSDKSRVKNDVLVVQLPHPSALSRLKPADASQAVARGLEQFTEYKESGWYIEPDVGQVNNYHAGDDFTYGRGDIGPEYYDFGTPASRMVSVSSAKRMRRKPNVIIIGTRDDDMFDLNKIDDMSKAKPASDFSKEELFIARPRIEPNKSTFDPGPGEKYAKIMKSNLNFDDIFQTKSGLSWKKGYSENGIDDFDVKTHPDVADFGHYRGKFKGAKVLVVADPDGNDDIITARALTGSRGQYLQGLMEDLGVDDNYLVVKTVPFGMDGASRDEWSRVLSKTEKYRNDLIKSVLEDDDNDIQFVLADGENAVIEMKRIYGEVNIKSNKKAKLIEVVRKGLANNFGLESAFDKEISKLENFKAKKVSGKLANIPRSHLSFYARIWEGTSGDRVLNADDKVKMVKKENDGEKITVKEITRYKGLAFAEVAPNWAAKQRTGLSKEVKKGVDLLISELEVNNLPLPNEDITSVVERLQIDLVGRSGVSFNPVPLPIDPVEMGWQNQTTIDAFDPVLEQQYISEEKDASADLD